MSPSFTNARAAKRAFVAFEYHHPVANRRRSKVDRKSGFFIAHRLFSSSPTTVKNKVVEIGTAHAIRHHLLGEQVSFYRMGFTAPSIHYLLLNN